ncbi:MAG: efflux RND transporter periplasmic adaptor subunit [Puniceicoccales bacterium]|nr:efflux RND transporter periplasmic adaptor subunit [Puniceicoccales bacterium]
MRPPMQLSVKAAFPFKTSVQRYIDAVGQCTAFESLTLVPQVEGELITVSRKNGGAVKEGDLLFEVDPRSLMAGLKQAEAQLIIDKAQLQLHQSQLQRSETLKTGDFVSQQEYDTYKANVAMYEGRVKLDEAACALKQVDLEHCFIRAPFDGELGKSTVNAHSFVSKGTTLATLNQVQPIYADCFLSEKYFNPLWNAKNTHNNHIVVEARLLDDSSVVQYGELVYVDNVVDKTTGSFCARSEFKNEDWGFWEGRAVDLKIYYAVLNNILLVPEASVHMGNKGSFVYVINAENVAEMRYVNVGQNYQEWVVIYSGLEGNEKIIADGHALLAPGSHVVVSSTLPAPQLNSM